MIIERQHYVWQHYLRAWASGVQVACLRGNRIFSANTANLAVKKQFYRIEEITDFDIHVVRQLAMSSSDPLVQKANEGWIDSFKTILELKRTCELLGQEHEEFERLAKEIIINAEEQLHGAIEKSAISHLAALRNQDLSLFASLPDLASFLHYLAVQFMRTDKTRTTFLGAIADIPGFNANNAWGLLRHVFATNISGSLFAKRDSLGVSTLEAPVGSEFITSDQPVVNLGVLRKAPGEEVRELDLYYPVSPRVALQISLKDAAGHIRKRQLSIAEVGEYNRSFMTFSAEQIFATTESVLEQICTPGQRRDRKG